MFNETYTTPEGFELPRRLLMPDARSFADVLEYVREWDYATMSHKPGKVPRPDLLPAPRLIGRNVVGPFCSINLSQLGGPAHRSIAVRATDAVLDVVAPRIVTPDDHLSFKVIGHKGTGRALVILEHGYIIGGHWLAYIDPATVPAP